MKIVRPLKPLLLSILILLLLTGPRPALAGVPPEQDVSVRINQLGYRTADAKSAIAFARVALPERFFLLDAGSRRPVFNGPARSVAGRWVPANS